MFGIGLSAQNSTNVVHYNVKGVFLESRNNGSKALIRHETIPGYMDAMTMPFTVKRPDELGTLKPGDEIMFRLTVTDTEDWIDEIRRTGASGPPPKSPPPAGSVAAELEPGAPVPGCVLTNQSGRALRLDGFQGQALAFTFFFSRCPLPTFCPRMNSNLGVVQTALLADASRTNWQLLSISFDPQFDTPGQLSGLAALCHADKNHWNFATGSPEVIRQLSGAFGLMVIPDGASFSHNLRTVVVDPAGRVRRVFTDNEWTPEELASEMKAAMSHQP
ncbi:MAG: SCO family protein [Verrucomicrobiota bacterium]